MERNKIITRAEKNPWVILVGIGWLGSYIPFILGIYILGAILEIPDGLISNIILWLLLFSIPIIRIWATIWYLKVINRSLMNLLWLFLPFGWIILLLYLKDPKYQVEIKEIDI